MSMTKKEQRLRRARQTRVRILGQGVARLAVHRSNLHIYASVFSGDGTQVLARASTAEKEVRDQLAGKNKTEHASLVGALIAQKALAAEVSQVVFDRNGFIYHGRVKAVADAAREAGLSF